VIDDAPPTVTLKPIQYLHVALVGLLTLIVLGPRLDTLLRRRKDDVTDELARDCRFVEQGRSEQSG
jgi:hypothetical protein